MKYYVLHINGNRHEFHVTEGTSLLWVLRENLELTGTKYGCGIAQCGACTIHVDGKPMRACILTIDTISEEQQITTIEGLSENGDHPVQKAWIAAQAPQCGYCQSGQIMQAVAFLEQNPSPTRDEIKTEMNGILCRCGTYMRIVKAVELASNAKSENT